MKKIDIKIPGKYYPVFIGKNIFNELWRLIDKKKLHRNVFIIIDSNVYKLHRSKIDLFINEAKCKVVKHEFLAKETNKNFSSLRKIFSDLIFYGFARDTLIIAIGGGITGDLAGLAAATFSRGVQFVQIPTTLLAAVDSSVGGKTGINFNDTKNIIGSFYQPEFVLIDTNFFQTLPQDEIICGTGEILKYAFLSDEKLFDFLKNNLHKLLSFPKGMSRLVGTPSEDSKDNRFTAQIIERCVAFKGYVVSSDEKESGLRAILNFGHTFAHAIEVEQKFKIKHGQAVTIGLACAVELSHQIGLLSVQQREKYLSLPLMLRQQITVKKFSAEKIYDIMKRDKKGKENKIKFVLLKEIGKLLIDVEAEKKKVVNSINIALQYFIKRKTL